MLCYKLCIIAKVVVAVPREKESSQGTFRRGIIPMAVLLALNNAEMYGYEIVQELKRLTNGALDVHEGSLYPVLYRLQEAGYVSDEKRQVGKRLTRVYYNITPEGRAYLRELAADYNAVHAGVLALMEFGGVGNE